MQNCSAFRCVRENLKELKGFFLSEKPGLYLFRINMRTWNGQMTVYSATAFLEKCRKVVREKWFEKSGSTKVVDQKKKVILYHKSTFFQVGEKWLTRKKKSKFAIPFFSNHFSRTRFLKPDFSNQISRTTFLHLSRKVVAD